MKIDEQHIHIEKNLIGYDKKRWWSSTITSSGACKTDGIALHDLLEKLMEAK